MTDHATTHASWAVSAARDFAYVLAVFLWSIPAFVVLVTGVSVAISLMVAVVGVALWLALAYLTRWLTDPETWCDLAWLGVASVAGFATGVAALTAAGVALVYASMPLWFWAISHPEQLYGLTNVGVFTVRTVPEALAVMAVGIALVPVAVLCARAGARAHAAMAAQLLGSRASTWAEAPVPAHGDTGPRSVANAPSTS